MCSVVGAGGPRLGGGPGGDTNHPTERNGVGPGGAGAQAAPAMKNVRQLLDEVGAKMQDICKVKVWVIDRAYLEPVMNTVGRHLQGIPCAYTEVIVDGLARPEMLMEIDVEVVKGG
jgi:enamine deaminase RidA (YjgF/YER057c/UK114 family)